MEIKQMPSHILFAVVALILSCISSLVSLIFNEIEGTGLGYSDTWSLSFSVLWVGIIAWLIWDIVKKRRDIRVTLAIVSVIMFLSVSLSSFDSNARFALIFEGLELVLWVGAFILLGTKQSQGWYQGN